eukprot:2549745-Pyramimonas_sp.AAC.1
MGASEQILEDLLALVEGDEYQSKIEAFCRENCKGTSRTGVVYRAQGPARRWQLGVPASELAYENNGIAAQIIQREDGSLAACAS